MDYRKIAKFVKDVVKSGYLKEVNDDNSFKQDAYRFFAENYILPTNKPEKWLADNQPIAENFLSVMEAVETEDEPVKEAEQPAAPTPDKADKVIEALAAMLSDVKESEVKTEEETEAEEVEETDDDETEQENEQPETEE
jgi:hypothetical protein